MKRCELDGGAENAKSSLVLRRFLVMSLGVTSWLVFSMMGLQVIRWVNSLCKSRDGHADLSQQFSSFRGPCGISFPLLTVCDNFLHFSDGSCYSWDTLMRGVNVDGDIISPPVSDTQPLNRYTCVSKFSWLSLSFTLSSSTSSQSLPEPSDA